MLTQNYSNVESANASQNHVSCQHLKGTLNIDLLSDFLNIFHWLIRLFSFYHNNSIPKQYFHVCHIQLLNNLIIICELLRWDKVATLKIRLLKLWNYRTIIFALCGIFTWVFPCSWKTRYFWFMGLGVFVCTIKCESSGWWWINNPAKW